MANPHSIQSSPENRVFLFLAVSRSNRQDKPHREEVIATSEQAARKKLAGRYVLCFAGCKPVPTSTNEHIVSYRAVINDGSELRERGLDVAREDILFLYSTNALGAERELCWLEMNEAHGEELDELMDSLPRSGVMAVVQAMVARSNSLTTMIDSLKTAKHSR